MGRVYAAVTVAAALTALSGCGDPLVVIGDSPGIVRIVAGVPDQAGDSLAVRATESELDTPLGLAADAEEVVYVADHRNRRVLAVASSGEIEALVDHSRRTEEPRLRGPDGLALDGGGLVIADPDGHRVWRLELESGTFAPIAGSGVRGTSTDTVDALEANLHTPTGVAVGADGRVYFSEVGAHRVRRIEPDGTLVTVAGAGIAGFSGDGGPATLARMARPAGLAVANGVLYISDSGNHRIRAVDLGTSIISTVVGQGVAGFGGDGGRADGAKLDTPLAVAVSSNAGLLFIADSDNQRVRVVSMETLTIWTFAGTGDENFNGDLLPAGQTTLKEPRGLAVSPLGLLYISDSGHHLVRRTAVTFVAAP